MINRYLEKEIKENISINEIFESQKVEDLEEIKKIYNQTPTTNILIEFDIEKINKSKLLNMYSYNSTENKFIWDRFVAIQVLKAIRKKHNDDISYLEEQEELIYNCNEEEYLETIFTNSNAGINSDGVKQLMSITNTLYRIHFIIRECENKSLYNAILAYLDIQPVMVYTDSNFKVKKVKMEDLEEHNIWDVYNYTIYNGLEAGIKSAKYRTKQKVKKYEEV